MLEPGNPWVAVDSGPTPTDIVLPDYRAAEYADVGTVADGVSAINPEAGERLTDSLVENADGPFAVHRRGLNGAATAAVKLNGSKLDGWREEDRISLIQQRLSEAGFDPGPVDGKMGPRTRAAFEAYEHSYNLTDQTYEELVDYMVASTHFESAYNSQKSGYHEKSIQEYSMVIRIRPTFPEAYFNRGLIYYAQGRYDHAIEDFSAAIDLQPRNKGAYLSRANAYYEKKLYRLAARDVFDAVMLGISTW
jgi:tetratricopeptide (TPR) repeat protein